MHNYEMAFEVYPPGVIEDGGPIRSEPKGYHHGCLVQLLPYVEERNTYRHVDHSVGVYHKNNAPVLGVNIPIYTCPSDSYRPVNSNPSSYAGVHHDVESPIDADNHGVFFLNSRVGYDDVTDGSSQTLFIGEKLIEDGDLGWMSGTRATLRNTGVLPNAEGGNGAIPLTAVGGFSSRHPSGVHFAFGDGSVRFISNVISLPTYQQLGHRADGKLLQVRP